MENKDFTVDISRQFEVGVEKLYAAWISPDDLKHWWKPMNKQLSEVVNDVKEQGKIKYIFEDDTLVIEGSYIEVKDKQKLVYTWNWHLPNDEIKDSAYRLTIEFSGDDYTSAIHVVQENFENEEGTLPHKEGWEKGLNDLKNYLEAKGNQQ